MTKGVVITKSSAQEQSASDPDFAVFLRNRCLSLTRPAVHHFAVKEVAFDRSSIKQAWFQSDIQKFCY